MTLFEVVILAIIQGITEFLPISSSAHLLLPSILLGWKEQGLAFDVAVHIGSLTAVVIYFRHDLWGMTQAWTRQLVGGKATAESQLAWWLIIATLPAVVLGFLGKSLVEEFARSGLVIAFTTIVFGALLWLADSRAKQAEGLKSLGWKKALTIGFFQVLAMIPGTSRSGITITAGLLLGLDRYSAARFSFLLSIPTILGAGVLLGLDLLSTSQAVDWSMIVSGTLLSFVSAYACIYLFLSWIERIGMLPFVIYRLLLGVFLLVLLL
ncbi:undecaprenyl-diphosphate phosphatase [Alteromonas sp. a30]|uniref:undecaprenyl-diphosphate phosphatase n=1 Tax=Alteromonas sp. a30 TaxID=2730917 RepID=UPI002282EE3C|nr:undecaprenyl-diphosphate phosphatase [Alteromonas sp. a30]MCY7296061.1 undecaprenyl-diphosphate phosphatase [Alteromonas sp. a30]